MPRQICQNCEDGYKKTESASAAAVADGTQALCNPCRVYLVKNKTSRPEHLWSAAAQVRALAKRAKAAGVAAEELAPAPAQAPVKTKAPANTKVPAKAKATAKAKVKVKATARVKRKAKVAPKAPEVTRAGRISRAPRVLAHYDLTKQKPRSRR